MSAHGISPAWKERSKFGRGQPWIFEPTAIISIFLACSFFKGADIGPTDIGQILLECSFQVDEADVGPELITQILLACSFQVDDADIGPLDITQILLDCSFQVDENDILAPITTVSLSCFTELV